MAVDHDCFGRDADVLHGIARGRLNVPRCANCSFCALLKLIVESQAKPARLNGNSRTRLPVAAKIALQSAGAKGGRPGSPIPAGGASLGTMWMYVSRGASFMRATW